MPVLLPSWGSHFLWGSGVSAPPLASPCAKPGLGGNFSGAGWHAVHACILIATPCVRRVATTDGPQSPACVPLPSWLEHSSVGRDDPKPPCLPQDGVGLSRGWDIPSVPSIPTTPGHAGSVRQLAVPVKASLFPRRGEGRRGRACPGQGVGSRASGQLDAIPLRAAWGQGHLSSSRLAWLWQLHRPSHAGSPCPPAIIPSCWRG